MSLPKLAFAMIVQVKIVKALEEGRSPDYIEGLAEGVVTSGRMTPDEVVEAVKAATARFSGGPRS